MAKIGFGIIGCGNIGPVHAAAIAGVRQARLVAVSDIVEASAKRLAGQYGVDAYTDFRALLERKDVHAVSLCVPSGMRAEIAEVCAAAGKHILSEKPLEVSTKRIDRIIRATDKAGVLLGCVFQSRFAEGTQHIRKAIETGRFGKLVLGDAYIKWYRSPEYYASGAWRGTRRLDGGGALMNQGIHQIDLLLHFMGPAKRVVAQTACIGHEGLEVEDLATAMIEFQNGAFGVIEGSTATWPGHPGKVEVHGTEGSAILENGELVFWRFNKRKPVDAKIEAAMGRESALGSGAGDPLAALKAEGHRRQIEDFAKAILQGRPPTVDGREGRHAVELIERIYKSAGARKAVIL
ncbi:MAG TPA: Gfo/Idh/MocA family oxidoreductase [Candidatus Hydrogenedentes bacterium]|nr:Gfo/Idh/MocA family oxidoreductase [Candidatus Hydrogenedentota bacterium]